MNIPNYEAVSGEGLYARNGAVFYKVTPAKGARVEGIVSVGMSYDEVPADSQRPYGDKVMVPALWIDYTPQLADGSYSNGVRTRQTLTVNGKEYGEGFGASVSGRVEFIPAKGNEFRAQYWAKDTVDGVDYLISGSVSQFDYVSDAARKTLSALAEAIAVEFITDERWHAERVEVAKYRLKSAMEKLVEAQQVVDAAQAELDAL